MFKQIRKYWEARLRDNNGLTPAQNRFVKEWLQKPRPGLQDYRRKFRAAPLGTWRHAEGTFSIVMDERWQFSPDHTGIRTEYGPFGHERGQMQFIWKEVADFTIACKVTYWPEMEPEADETLDADGDNAEAEESGWNEWEIIRYDFRIVLVEGAETIAMSRVTLEGEWQSGFWHSMTPLAYSGEWQPSEIGDTA